MSSLISAQISISAIHWNSNVHLNFPSQSQEWRTILRSKGDTQAASKWTNVKEHFEYLILIYGKQPIFFTHVSVLAPFPNHNQASHNCSLITNNSILPNKTNNLCMMWVYNPRSWGAEAGRWRVLSSGFWAKSYITLLLCTPFILSQKTLHIVVISSQNLKCLLLSDRLYIALQHNIPVLLYK